MREGRTWEITKAYDELLELLKDFDDEFMTGPNHVADDEQLVVMGYKWIFSILQVAMDVYLWGDSAAPRFVDIVGPYKKWGGDNTDAYYQFAPVDPARTYTVRGTASDAVYFSLTVYGGPNDGNYTTRIVGIVNNRDLELGPNGEFEFLMGPERPEGYDGVFLAIDGDAVHAITRDYLVDARTGTRVEWTIEASDRPPTYRESDEEAARRFRAVITWLKDQAAMVPIPVGQQDQVDEERNLGHQANPDSNKFDDPYPVPENNFGWSAGDAAYAFGKWDLAPDEALVVEGTSPECAFWSINPWSPFLHTFNADYERLTLNHGQVELNDDGSFTIVMAHEMPDHPNGLSLQGNRRGFLCFRWFLPERTPDPLTTRVIKVSEIADL